MDPAAFSNALHKGLGRCVLLFRKGASAAPYKEVLLENFRHEFAFDPQCEGTRSTYLVELAEHTGLVEELKAAAFDGSKNTEHFWDHAQHTAVAAAFARKGDNAFATILREQLTNTSPEHECFSNLAWAVESFDGLAGFLLVAQRLGATQQSEVVLSESARHLARGEEDFGAEELHAHLRSLVEHDSTIATFLSFARTEQPRIANTLDAPMPSLQELLNKGQQKPEGRRFRLPFSWGKKATSEQLEQALQALKEARDEEDLQTLLGVFRYVEHADSRSVLLRFLQHSSSAVQEAAIEGLAQAPADERVRDAARQLLAQELPQWEALALLEHNYREGDAAFVAARLPLIDTQDASVVHSVGFGLLYAFSGEHRSPEIIGPMRWLYEHSPCSMCRRDAVEALLTYDGLDPLRREECSFDSNDDIRALVDDESTEHRS